MVARLALGLRGDEECLRELEEQILSGDLNHVRFAGMILMESFPTDAGGPARRRDFLARFCESPALPIALREKTVQELRDTELDDLPVSAVRALQAGLLASDLPVGAERALGGAHLLVSSLGEDPAVLLEAWACIARTDPFFLETYPYEHARDMALAGQEGYLDRFRELWQDTRHHDEVALEVFRRWGSEEERAMVREVEGRR